MPVLHYRLVNVFAESTFGGNPLCVFEDARALNDAQMQALALQFNLSETTFILPSTVATARVRIFTPTFEMPFAGHPTLGTAHVIRDRRHAGDELTLEMTAGVIPVSAVADRWTLKAGVLSSRDCELAKSALAKLLGLDVAEVLDGARWMNTGSEQLVIPLASVDAVRRAKPVANLLGSVASDVGRSMAYVFATDGSAKFVTRFFFMKYGGVVEDPGTGSAAANLGGWMWYHRHAPGKFALEQGDAVARPCRLGLEVTARGDIFVSGRVIEIGRGSVDIG